MGRALTAQEFETLYRATVRDVLAYVRRRTSGDAEDIVAETYAVAWRRRSELPNPTLRRAWLFGVARNLLIADGRQQQREGKLVSQLAAGPGPTVSPTANQRTVRVVAAALGRLAPNDKEILRLVSWEGLTPAELAVALGVRPGTARVRLHRARQALASDPEIKTLLDKFDPAILTMG